MTRATILIAGTILATGALAQDFGGQPDQDYALNLWNAMAERNLAGADAIGAFPYEGTDPHGVMLETFYTSMSIDGHDGALVIKRNYGPQGVTADDVIGSPDEHLASVTIMYRREEGYAPDSGDWFWAKYLADGSLDASPEGVPLAGTVGSCIACHSGAEGDGDYLFTTDAELD